MQTYSSGQKVGSGSFRCDACQYNFTLEEPAELPKCCSCGGTSFYRASIFIDPATQPIALPEISRRALGRGSELEDLGSGHYLAYEQQGDLQVFELEQECTRIGRSIKADIQLNDATVSRRHAIIQRHERWMSILDDRSLNGLFVNGEHVERSRLNDGDEILIGRFRLIYIDTTKRDLGSAANQAIHYLGSCV